MERGPRCFRTCGWTCSMSEHQNIPSCLQGVRLCQFAAGRDSAPSAVWRIQTLHPELQFSTPWNPGGRERTHSQWHRRSCSSRGRSQGAAIARAQAEGRRAQEGGDCDGLRICCIACRALWWRDCRLQLSRTRRFVAFGAALSISRPGTWRSVEDGPSTNAAADGSSGCGSSSSSGGGGGSGGNCSLLCFWPACGSGRVAPSSPASAGGP